MWTTQEAIDIAPKLEMAAAPLELHIALTGGLLYKNGKRKDADFVVYRHNKNRSLEDQPIEREAFEGNLRTIGFEILEVHPAVTKIAWEDRPIDLLYVELRGAYEGPDDVGEF